MNVFVTVVTVIFIGALLGLAYYVGQLDGWSAGYKYRETIERRAQEADSVWGKRP